MAYSVRPGHMGIKKWPAIADIKLTNKGRWPLAIIACWHMQTWKSGCGFCDFPRLLAFTHTAKAALGPRCGLVAFSLAAEHKRSSKSASGSLDLTYRSIFHTLNGHRPPHQEQPLSSKQPHYCSTHHHPSAVYQSAVMTFSETVTRNPERCYGNTQAHVLDYYNSGSFADVIANRVLDVKERYILSLNHRQD